MGVEDSRDDVLEGVAVANEDSKIYRLGMGSFVAMQCMGLDTSECETVVGDLALMTPDYHKIDDSACYVVGWSGRRQYMQMVGYKNTVLYWTQPITIGHFNQGRALLAQALTDHERMRTGVTERPRRRVYESQPVRNLTTRPSSGSEQDASTLTSRPTPNPASLQAPQPDSAGFTYSDDPRPMAQIFGPGIADAVDWVEERIARMFFPGKKGK